MGVTSDQKVLLEREVRKAYDAFQDRQRGLKDVIKERIEKEHAAALESDRVALSKLLHDFYAKGLSKAALKRATRKYSNQYEWRKLWDAYTVENELPLTTATSRQVDVSGDSLTFHKLEGVALTEPFTINNVEWDWSLAEDDFIPAWRYESQSDWKIVESNAFVRKALVADLIANVLGDKPEGVVEDDPDLTPDIVE